jgi:hypothetical protein
LGVSSYSHDSRPDLRLYILYGFCKLADILTTHYYTLGHNVSVTVDANLGGTDNNALAIFGYNVTDLCAGS